MPSARFEITARVRVRPMWDQHGRCYARVVASLAGGRKRYRTLRRYPEGDKPPDPADWWKHEGRDG